MTLGLIGKKVGMSRIFTEDGESIPVTVVHAEPNRVTQLKTVGKDGYSAVQVTTGKRRKTRVGKAMAGHFAKAQSEPGSALHEFRLSSEEPELQVGADLKVDSFSVGQKVDVQGTTIGKGFAGVVKRHGFGGGRATHGNSLSHRAPGSVGQNQTPGRVFPGKRMAGHMGNVKRTQQNLEVVRIDVERNLILIRGSLPGPKGGGVVIKPAAKLSAAAGADE